MSLWSYVHGAITVSPPGLTQAHKAYVLDTILAHLPQVTGSEENMQTYVAQCNGYDASYGCDEFMVPYRFSPKATYKDRGSMHLQSHYLIAVRGQLRDRYVELAYRELLRWLVRLAKRVYVDAVTVSVYGDALEPCTRPMIITNDKGKFSALYEWSPRDEDDAPPAWTDFMMWERDESGLPLELAYKYYNDSDLDREIERRKQYRAQRKLGSVADWMRLGYSAKEAKDLAKNMSIYAKIGDKL